MKTGRFWYHVSVEITLTRAEHEHLVELSKNHYDGTCRSLCEQGGFLYGWGNRFWAADLGEPDRAPQPGDTMEARADFGQLDILCKLCEQDCFSSAPNPELTAKMHEAIRAVRAETERANARVSP